jgi:hypothetical protein
VRILRVFKQNTSNVRGFFLRLTNFYKYYHVRSKQHTTPSRELKFQMQAMMKMMNFMMGNVFHKLEKVGKTWLEHVPKT